MTYLRNTWYVALWAKDLEAGRLLPCTLLDEHIVFFRDPQGGVRALEDRCPHRMAPLHMGQLLPSGALRCAYHGLEFDASGACVRNPHASGRIPPAARVKTYPVAEKHSLIWIWMGDAPADASRIPDFELLDGAHEVSKRDYILMEADYRLVTDNLMDLSHTAFLHDGILGSQDTVVAELQTRQSGHTVTVARRVPNAPVPGFFDLMYRRDGGRVDLWADIRWDAPGCLLNDTGVTAPGQARALGTGIYGMHFLTPQTAASTHYHFAAVRQHPTSWGEPLDTEIRQKVSELRRYAFEFQDKAVIEAQQRVIAQRTQPPAFVLLETDGGTVRYRRILDELIAAESAPSRPEQKQPAA